MKWSEDEVDKVAVALAERLKELECLNFILKLQYNPDKTPDEIFQEIVNMLPVIWDHSDVSCARIIVDNKEFCSEKFRETEWMQSADITSGGIKVGSIEIAYLEERPESYEGPFHAYERYLLDAVSLQLGLFYRQIIAEKKLKQHMKNLENTVETRTKDLDAARLKLDRQERLALIGQLAGGVSHDLRNPIGSIKNAVYYLKMVLENPAPDVTETLTILDKEVENADNILQTLLDFARPRPPMIKKCTVADIIDNTLSQIDIPQFVMVETQIPEENPAFEADCYQMQRVMLNVIENAVQAMPEGGTLTIAARSDELENSLKVTVSDTGTGIPDDDLDQLFEPLFTSRPKGVGLGLSIVKSLIERHNGTISVESSLGKGSTFCINLPLHYESGEQNV